MSGLIGAVIILAYAVPLLGLLNDIIADYQSGRRKD